MARSGPDTATSDFFICIGDQPSLDFGGGRNPDGQGFAAFGRVGVWDGGGAGDSQSAGGRRVAHASGRHHPGRAGHSSIASGPHGGTTPAASQLTALSPRRSARSLLLSLAVPSLIPSDGMAQPLCIAVGADHGGFDLKQQLVVYLQGQGHQIRDCGTNSTEAVDYPVFAEAVARLVGSGACDFGIVVDGAGIGSAMAANKVPTCSRRPATAKRSPAAAVSTTAPTC